MNQKNNIMVFILVFFFNVGLSNAQDSLLGEIRTSQTIEKGLYNNVSITTISISPLGNKIVTGATDLIVWDSQSREKLIEYLGHGKNTRICASAISNIGDLVISGAYGNDVKIWNINNGNEIKTLKTKGEYNKSINGLSVSGVDFMFADQVAITSNNSGVLQLWNLKNGNEIDCYDNLGNIYSIRLSPDQDILIIQLWSNFFLLNLDNRKRSKIYWGKNATFSNKNSSTIISTQGNSIQIYNVKNNELELHKEYILEEYQVIKDFTISPSGEEIILGKVANFHPVLKYNFVYDRESINIENGKIQKKCKMNNITNFIDYNQRKKLKREYNDNIILYFPIGDKYLTLNGSSINIWKNEK